MAQAQVLQGVTKDQELDPRIFDKDVRSTSKKVVGWLSQPTNMNVCMFMFVGAAYYYAALAHVIVLLMLPLTLWAINRKEKTPIKLPVQSGMMDANEINPATEKPGMAQGIFFIGNCLTSGKEIWLTNDDCRQHFLVLGTTGAGKSTSRDSLVHTPMGWRRTGDLVVGDDVSCPVENVASKVTGVFPQGIRSMWKLHFEDGRAVEADGEHLWEVDTSTVNGTLRSVLTTQALHVHLQDGNQVSVPMSVAMEKPASGIGIEAARRMGERDGRRNALHAHPNQDDEGIEGACREGSIAERSAYLHGVTSVSGFLHDWDDTEVWTCSATFADELRQVAWSLGYLARTDTGSNPTRTGIAHTVKIRKATRLRVTSIEPDVREADAVCIMVDHPRHLYVMDQYVVTHNTELLIGFAANAISWGSGLLYCDGKGDVSLFAKMYALARKYGREDDLLVLNFMNGNKDDSGGDGRVRSNTLNPFSNGASDGLTQMIVGLMAEAGGDGAMWKGRAVSMLTGTMKALVWLRDKGQIDLNVGTIREYMNLANIISLASAKDHPMLPKDIRISVQAYLNSLPGYVESKGAQQAQTTLDQHGYLQMQFSQIFGSLNDVYGHIFKSAYGQIDMSDVVLNRRILVIMLPALEKSGEEIANLGKIVAANLKGMMGGTLGSNLEGNWTEVVDNRPTSAPSPFMCILDEVGYYTVDGMALMAAQARSLGFSMIYASQDIPAMQRNNEKEAASIIANTNTKIFMRTEEADKTGALAVASGGEVHRASLSNMERFESDLSGGGYRGGQSVNFQQTKRISFLDLKSQGPGELTITYKGEIVRAKSFYADPSSSLDKEKLNLRPNHFIEVIRPDPSIITKDEESVACTNFLVSADCEDKMAAAVKETMDGMEEAWASANEVAIAARTWERACAADPNQMIAAACVIAQIAMASSSGSSTRASVRDVAMHARRRNMDDMDPSEGMMRDRDMDRDMDEPDAFDSTGMSSPIVSKRPKAKMDAGVTHGVSLDENNIWNSAKTASNRHDMLKCLADLDYDDHTRTSQDIDQMVNSNLNVPDGLQVDPKALATKAQQFEDMAHNLQEIQTEPEQPPRRQPPQPVQAVPTASTASTASSAQAMQPAAKAKAATQGDDKDGDGTSTSTSTGTGTGAGAGGKNMPDKEDAVEDFIKQLMAGED